MWAGPVVEVLPIRRRLHRPPLPPLLLLLRQSHPRRQQPAQFLAVVRLVPWRRRQRVQCVPQLRRVERDADRYALDG